MPTSRKRARPKKRRRQGISRSPYESLIRGVQADQRLLAWWERAVWSFHRAPFPVYPDLEAQDAAMARALEWFAFDLVLPDSGRTPAEDWIALEAERQRWSAPVTERYLRFTRGEYGLFEIAKAPLPMLFLREIESDRVVHAVTMDASVPFEAGQIVAARLFPLEDAGGHGLDREVFELSPGSDFLPRVQKKALRPALEEGALGVEALYGARPDWIGDALASGDLVHLADAFLAIASGDGVAATDLQQELREIDDPSAVILAVTAEVDPLTREEPALLGTLIAGLWVSVRHPAGTSDKTLRKLAKTFERTLTATLSQRSPSAPSLFSSVEDTEWRLSEHEVARLRSLPRAADVEWIGRRRQVKLAIHEEGTLPEYPDAILWYEQPSGLILSATVVRPREPQSRLLQTLVEAMTQPPRGGESPRRPARVFVQSQTIAARLARALAPLDILVQARYVEPDLTALFANLEERTAGDEEDAMEGVLPPEMRYLRLPGSTSARAERLFTAAADFYRAAPWKQLADDVSIDLDFPVTRTASGSPVSRAIAVIMGHGRQTFGLALYFNPADLVSMQLGAPLEDARRYDTLSVTFDNERGTEPGIVAEIREHGWPVADRRAFPTALRTSPGAPLRLIAGEELDLAAAALDAVREFVAQHGRSIASNVRTRCSTVTEVPRFGNVRATFGPPPEA